MISRYVWIKRCGFIVCTIPSAPLEQNCSVCFFGARVCIGWMKLRLTGKVWCGWKFRLETRREEMICDATCLLLYYSVTS